MKKTKLMMVLPAVMLSLSQTNAAEPSAPAKESAGVLASLYAAPVGVYRLPNIHDKGEWGAGIEVGVQLSKYVALGIQNISYAGEDTWQDSGLLVDETSAQVHTTLFTSDKGALSLGVDAVGVRDWNTEDWGFGAGPRVGIRLADKFYLNFGTQVRAFMRGGKDLYNYGNLSYTF